MKVLDQGPIYAANLGAHNQCYEQLWLDSKPATNVVTRTGPDTVTWQSKDRTVDGKDLPEIKETKMKRVSLTPR